MARAGYDPNDMANMFELPRRQAGRDSRTACAVLL